MERFSTYRAVLGASRSERVSRTVACACAAIVLPFSSAFGSIDDMAVRFSTPGIDCYADGTPVCDGECYALVWSPVGRVFGGFNADGTASSADDRVVLVGALARNGRCPDTLFQIPKETYEELAGGEWAVCLVDTRNAGGLPTGVDGGLPRRVNRWAAVEGGVRASSAGAMGALPAAAMRRNLSSASADAGVCADTLSAVPDSVTQPRITGFEVVDGVARLTVEGTVPFLTYTISAGDTPDALTADDAAGWVDGDTAKPIEIETDAVKGSRFFKVTRAE